MANFEHLLVRPNASRWPQRLHRLSHGAAVLLVIVGAYSASAALYLVVPLVLVSALTARRTHWYPEQIIHDERGWSLVVGQHVQQTELQAAPWVTRRALVLVFAGQRAKRPLTLFSDQLRDDEWRRLLRVVRGQLVSVRLPLS